MTLLTLKIPFNVRLVHFDDYFYMLIVGILSQSTQVADKFKWKKLQT